MWTPKLSPDEEAEIYETVQRELPQIDKAVKRMAKQLKDLSDVSQKQAIARLVSDFVLWVYPDNKERALLLSEHMRDQVDINIRHEMGEKSIN